MKLHKYFSEFSNSLAKLQPFIHTNKFWINALFVYPFNLLIPFTVFETSKRQKIQDNAQSCKGFLASSISYSHIITIVTESS